jgi:hypothetical protein
LPKTTIKEINDLREQAYCTRLRRVLSLDTPGAKDRIEVAKKNYSAIEITPLFMVTWEARIVIPCEKKRTSHHNR